MAFYTPTGIAGTIGETSPGFDDWKITPLCKRLDRLASLTACSKRKELNGNSKARHQKCYQLTKKKHRLIEKIKNMISDAHRKTAHWLCSKFNTILVPEYRARQMLPTLSSKVARAMSTWAFYRFKLLLRRMAERWGVTVVDADEAYTSKTCGRCGKMKAHVGGRVFSCDQCGLVMDRDVHAARNIFLKNMHLVVRC